MRKHIFLVALTTAAALPLASPPAWAATGPWEQTLGNNEGGATVNKDADKITVCDNISDETFIKAKYTNSYNFAFTVEAPSADCESDRTWISYIKSFQVCWGHKSWDRKSVIWDGCMSRVKTG
ncbi:hypothetical protein GCM10022419_047440 [Nonomuraea rosea]|uniref:Uncharacterized protein n=1 Tax=Nonomuraea rosea TaxID=638574 RepID=A0ABP6X6T4_9ACTN